MECVNKRCFLNGSINRHVNVGIDHPTPESGCRKFDKNEVSGCECFVELPDVCLQWFAGNGFESQKKADLLKDELHEALNIISMLQQPIHADSEKSFKFQEEQNVVFQQRLENITTNLYESLSGEKL